MFKNQLVTQKLKNPSFHTRTTKCVTGTFLVVALSNFDISGKKIISTFLPAGTGTPRRASGSLESRSRLCTLR